MGPLGNPHVELKRVSEYVEILHLEIDADRELVVLGENVLAESIYDARFAW